MNHAAHRARGRRALRTLLVDYGTFLVLALSVLITAALSSGCGANTNSKQALETTTSADGTKTAIVRVTGTPGTPFKGSYGSTSAGMESVEGEATQDYEVRYNSFPGALDTISATMQKRVEDYSKLTVQIVVDGQTKKEKSTASDFGVAKVSWSPSEQ